jgi:hypothetical protein
MQQQFEAGAEDDSSGALERGQDLVGGVCPDDGAGLGQRVTSQAALGKLQVNVAIAGIHLDDFSSHPFTGTVGASNSLGNARQELRQADAFGRQGQFGAGIAVLPPRANMTCATSP